LEGCLATPTAVEELISNPFIGAQKIYSREAGVLLRLNPR